MYKPDHPKEEKLIVSSMKNNGGYGQLIYSGVLEKRGHFRKNWLARLFVLTNHSLSYYKPPPTATAPTTNTTTNLSAGNRKTSANSNRQWSSCSSLLRGELHVSRMVNVTMDENRLNYFILKVAKPSSLKRNRTVEYHIQASSQEERDKWVNYIRFVIKNNNPRLNSQSPASASAPPTMSTNYSEGKDLLVYLVSPELKKINPPLLSRHSSSSSSSWSSSKISAIGDALISEFPVLVRLLKDVYFSLDTSELVHALDQIAGEIRDGAFNDDIKKVVMAVGQMKHERDAAIWTEPVKAAYGTIMLEARTFKPNQGRETTVNYIDSSGCCKDDGGSRCFNEVYTLSRVLGAGASSIVHVAYNKETSRQFAVKCISKKGMKHEQISSFKREVEIMQKLNHKNLVPLIDYFEEKEFYYIVTPLCTGGELFDELVKRECYTEEDARVLIKKLASAILYLHKQGIVHRDLKPENILLKSSAPEAEVMIADFGFAKSTNGIHQGTACGTPGYIAPEVVTGKPYGTEVDCWSLGVILYILLCGYPPFPGDNHADILRRVANAEYTFDSPNWDTVSNEAKDLVKKLLELDPSARLTAQGIIHHEWTSFDDDEVDLADVVITRMKRTNSDLTPALKEMKKFNHTSHKKNITNQNHVSTVIS